jgi:hypothetical protein
MNIQENYVKNANSFLSENEEEYPIEKIRDEAIAAFFDKVSEFFPDAVTKDLDSISEMKFEKECEQIIRSWIEYNA